MDTGESSTRNRERQVSQNASSKARDDARRHVANDGEKADPKYVGQWKIGKIIGKGSSGRVKLARHAVTKEYAAVKIVPRPRQNKTVPPEKTEKLNMTIEREIVIMKLIEHPNVLRLIDVWETESELFLIMEYVPNGELFDYLVSKGRLHVDEALHYFQQIIAGLDYCHHYNICHRDLKPENLLLDKNNNIKIADFGMAALEKNDRLLETSCGSPHYASPEIVMGRSYHGAATDIWSCGIILYALLTGRLPFDDENIRELLAKVKKGKYYMPPELPSDAQDLIRRMLEVDPEQRITMPEIQAHPFVQRNPPRIPYSPPNIAAIERPVASKRDIDPDILNNLQTLWHGASEREIIKALLAHEKNWEKVFYDLLCKYRSRSLEEYLQEDEAPRMHKKKEHVVNSGPVASKSKHRPRASISQKWLASPPESRVPSVPNSPAKNRIYKTSNPNSPKSKVRNSPPRTPRTAAPKVRPINFDKSSPPKTVLQEKPRLINLAAPSTPLQSLKDKVPAIQLQEASPIQLPPKKELKISATGSPNSQWESIPNSPLLPLNFNSPVSPIQIPETGNLQMQQFFSEIVDQLQTMSARSSISSQQASPTFSQGSPIDYGFRFADPYQFEQEQERISQFEDAEDDVESAQENIVSSRNSILEHGRQSRGSYVSSHGSHSRLRSRGSNIAPAISSRDATQTRTEPYEPCQVHPSTSDWVVVADSLPRSFIPGGQRSRVPSRDQGALRTSMLRDEKENIQIGRPAPARPSKADGVFHLSAGSNTSQRSRIHSEDSTASRVSKKSDHEGGPKHSWFANLFHWKHLQYTLQSTEGVNTTRRVCADKLRSFGIQVQEVQADARIILKCRAHKLFDAETGSELKPVRFRVEFNNRAQGFVPNGLDTTSPFATLVVMILEKGAHSSFKVVHTTLDMGWRLGVIKYTHVEAGQPLASRQSSLEPSPIAF